MKGVGRESGHASINKILLLLYHDQGLSVITTLLLGSGEAWIRVQRVSQGLPGSRDACSRASRTEGWPRGTGDGDANQQIASPQGGSVHGLWFPGPSVKDSNPMGQPVD